MKRTKPKPKPKSNKNNKLLLIDNIKNQLFTQRLSFFICLVAGLIGIAVTFVIAYIANIPFSYLSRDMAAVCNIKEYIGFLSNIGILLWAFTAAICVFTANILKMTNKNHPYSSFFLFSGILSLFLVLDDIFLFHERVAPNYLHFPEGLIHVSYVIIIIIFIISFFNKILSTDYLLFLSAGFFLALSMLADNIFPLSENETIFEDSVKFLGITFWFGYYVRTSQANIKDLWIQTKSIKKKV